MPAPLRLCAERNTILVLAGKRLQTGHIGSEGELAIAQAIVYMACAAKSNAVYNAFNAVRDDIRQGRSLEVPIHLRNAPTKLMKAEGYGAEYRYAHDYPDGYAAGENYLPPELRDKSWYQPVPRGLEIKIGEKLAYLRSLDEKSPWKRYINDGADKKAKAPR